MCDPRSVTYKIHLSSVIFLIDLRKIFFNKLKQLEFC